jgi:NADH:ubiquinone oxidoreductase subunit H
MLIITIPFNYNNFFYFNYSLLLFLVINSFGVFALILTGISSYSKYTVLGSLRAVSQFISYEIVLSFIFLFIILVCSSFNFIDIIFYQQINLYLIYPFFPIFLIFFISILAETNRSPFDLPEAESELVSGYSTEYGASPFVFFFF